ncbi:centrosomal protein of 55 kDa isoform X2 [Denticeps clupeoides]|uniref:centrosomal protein of 55 kDa isoform X2 n=1 Tax=Denticeps clupeoides TaxID=299321 RepID=UPI0010A34C5E|nr:centrosomal protein of 55 kDa isoform X2 [Denticeps clupeoides]
MASGAAKKAFASKLGFRSAAASAEQELDKLRRENVRLKETLDDMAKRAGRQDPGAAALPEAPSGEIAALQEQLSDALEKNRQWLVYDQQREAFVRGLLARLQELEKPASRANGALQQQHKGADSTAQEGGEKLQAQAELDQLRRRLEEASREAARAQEELDRLRRRLGETSRAQEELDRLRRRLGETSRAQEELDQLRRRLGETSRAQEELDQLRKRLGETSRAQEVERQNWAERARHLQAELESANARLEDERRRTADLLQQSREDGRQVLAEERQNWAERARHLQAELESANARLEDERRRTAELLQQEQRHQNVQRQLHKMQKELRKAREEIARLDLAKQQRELHVPETGYYDGLDLERLAIEDHPSPSKMPSLLDTSFLECPSCKTQYPASRHSELLAHIEYCYYADA